MRTRPFIALAGDYLVCVRCLRCNWPTMSVSVEDTAARVDRAPLVARSVRHAESAQAALQARVAKAKEQVEALNQRG